MARTFKRTKQVSKVIGPSKTQVGGPSMDINDIMRRHQPGTPLATGFSANPRQPRFIDVSAVDYLESLNRVVDAKNSFASLPSRLRARFSNDPHQLLRFLDDPKNVDEAVKLGLMQKVVAPDLELKPKEGDPPKA